MSEPIHGATGWRYLTSSEGDPADYSSPTFNDFGWAEGAGPFANGLAPAHVPLGWTAPATLIGTNVSGWFRRRVPSGFSTTVWLDGSARFYLDGVLFAEVGDVVATFPLVVPSSGLLAVRIQDDVSDPGLDWTYFDMAVPPTTVPPTRQYPRDDGLGLSGAPRLYPLPRAVRVVGGLQ